ncbi:methylated-DNA--[protein]-cysteine S-methyltransferase [Sapientia aquatica]|uniref:Methylated-DNA--protein-cysteine methyltransferase n=1 Tax=Sapientia aquatica TaxID=1549640 RepID=A0A4R5VNV3_9BURK|nr:methylated-DNA--[protein]-cysteine S-methyltransferase [Sapientia aquatica]TDK59998.1 methylated-DNA--[protein]-cysteine S-methyltransferase [Sapientia aquatica]
MTKSISYTQYVSPLGEMTLAGTKDGLCGAYFFDQRSFKGIKDWPRDDHNPHLVKAAKELSEYFAGKRDGFDVQLDLAVHGTAFQQSVWRALLNIEFGQTSTYGAHANSINKPLAVRAVGGAIGKNPISIIVPCHRVIGSNGALTGYDGGLDRKKYLLRLEGVL